MRTLIASLTALIIPIYYLLVVIIFFGFAVFALEYDPRDLTNSNRVSDLPTTWWMMLVTMTTVGYGDFSPQTTMGRALAGVSILFAPTILAMSLAIVSDEFTAAWKDVHSNP